jgi:hypothetical protein
MSRTGRLCVAGPLASLLIAAACSDSAITAPTSPVTATIAVSQESFTVSATRAVLTALASAAGPFASLDPASVDSLFVTVTRVEVLPDSALYLQWRHEMRERFAGDTMEARVNPAWGSLAADWYRFDVVGSGRIDLVHLPTTAGTGLLLASADVPPGVYAHARLFVSGATIWFHTPVDAGAYTFAADTGYTVTIPSADSTGIKTDAGFTVPDGGGTIELAFDPGAAIRNASATGTGTVVLTPVLRSRGVIPGL